MEQNNMCKICSERESKYMCPRCNVTYCSVTCYQSETHVQCSESFYRECVVEQIKDGELDPESQQRMVEILQRVQQIDGQFEAEDLDSDDDDSCDELERRLAGVDLDNAESVWERLTDQEKAQFQELVSSGDLSEVLPLWEPWWSHRKQKKLVEDLDKPSSSEVSAPVSSPLIRQDIQPLSKLCKTPPSSAVRWNVINVLAAYALTARVYNGEHQSAALDAVEMLVALSTNLATNQVFDGPEMAMTSVRMAAISAGIFAGGIDEEGLEDDVEKLLNESDLNKSNMLAALSDIHVLLTSAKRNMKKPTKSKPGGEFSMKFPNNTTKSSSIVPVTVTDLNKCLRKVEFYLSWAKDKSVY